jgi:hypothetical protein
MAKLFTEMNNAELTAEKAELENRLAAFKAMGLKLDMSRGKPGSDQLDISNGLNNAELDYIEDALI